MLTKAQIEKEGYTVIPEGMWVCIDPTMFPHDWERVAKACQFDPNCKEVILCVVGFKEVPYENND
jgi:hypothetical protein